MPEPIAQHDERERYCPMLGHEIRFGYCRAPGRDIPCRKIFDCWWERFDIRSFIREHFTEEAIGRILAPPRAKAETIFDLIAQAREQAKEPVDPPGGGS
jgi:hypothetical protein